MSLESTSPIRLVAWKIAEQFKTLSDEVFAQSSELDKKENGGQTTRRWWNEQTTYRVNIAAHVGENLKWWSLSPDEKDQARKLGENREKSEAAQKEFQDEFPFDEAYLELPKNNGKITDLGNVITRVQNEAFIVAYLEGLAEIHKDEPCGSKLRKLAKKAASKAAPYCKAKMKWNAFKEEATKEIRRLLPLE